MENPENAYGETEQVERVIAWLQRSINYYFNARELARKYRQEALEDNSKEILASTFKAQEEMYKKESIKHARLLVQLDTSQS